VAEAALAHSNRDKVEAAYRRSDLFDQRAPYDAMGRILHPPGGQERQSHHHSEARVMPFISEQQINEILDKHYVDAKLPHTDSWIIPAGVINLYIRDPWTNSKTETLKKIAIKAKKERKIFNDAAKILESDAEQFGDTLAEHHRRWAEAIIVLRYPRGATDNPRDRISKIKPNGPAVTAPVYIAVEIASCLVQILMRAEITVSSSDTSPFIKSLM
jgi:hypothetical protein